MAFFPKFLCPHLLQDENNTNLFRLELLHAKMPRRVSGTIWDYFNEVSYWLSVQGLDLHPGFLEFKVYQLNDFF
jgi:hypothetical protein